MAAAFLRIPPFPRRRAPPLAQAGASRADPEELAALLREARVGGSFWGAQPEIAAGTVILAPTSAAQLQEMLAGGCPPSALICAPRKWAVPARNARIDPGCDPWWLAAQAGEIRAGADHELALVAALSGRALRLYGDGAFRGCDRAPETVLARAADRFAYADPFTGDDWSAVDAARQLGEWRQLIDANRAVAGIYGVARWKQVTLDALLWDGGALRYRTSVPRSLAPGERVAAWKSRTPPALLRRLEARGAAIGEIEDGFIRSIGLGANCVPPLSAILDFAGIYFDPAGPSDLEDILEHREIDPSLCRRAAALRTHLVQAGVSKYGRESPANRKPAPRPEGGRRRILVTGQVEDDRSITSGGGGITNLEVIVQARRLEPDALIIYKPHPDVEAGHRTGHVPDSTALRYADEISRDIPITSLIDTVDAVHVITSLAGFEALLRGKCVTTHGTPFYAGWGLTRDLGAGTPRRTRRRSLDELIAATLLLYPRYLDPVTRLPCSAEVMTMRMARGEARVTSPLVMLREIEGRARSAVRALALQFAGREPGKAA